MPKPDPIPAPAPLHYLRAGDKLVVTVKPNLDLTAVVINCLTPIEGFTDRVILLLDGKTYHTLDRVVSFKNNNRSELWFLDDNEWPINVKLLDRKFVPSRFWHD